MYVQIYLHALPFADEQLHNNAPHRKCIREKTTACVSMSVFLESAVALSRTVLRTTPIHATKPKTIHRRNQHVAVITLLSFSGRLAIANLSSTGILSHSGCIEAIWSTMTMIDRVYAKRSPIETVHGLNTSDFSVFGFSVSTLNMV